MLQKFMIIIVFIIILSGCHSDVNVPIDGNNNAPVPPQGLLTIAQDQQVYLNWYYNYETNVSGYNVYISDSYKGRYKKIGFTTKNEYFSAGLSNGTTYYYAVTAYNRDGFESDLSVDQVFATPRPEVFNVTVYDYKTNPNRAGYNLYSNSIYPFDSKNTDIYFENSNGVYYMNVFKDSDIQDMGYTSSFDEIVKSPVKGWSPTKDVQAIIGHTYVIWTFDNHYAKFRVTDLFPDRVVFSCSFQLQTANPYLKRNVIKK